MGDLLVSSLGTLIPIESITSLNEITTVYNLNVADQHTYLVGGALWGWDVQVHNTRCTPGVDEPAAKAFISKAAAGEPIVLQGSGGRGKVISWRVKGRIVGSRMLGAPSEKQAPSEKEEIEWKMRTTETRPAQQSNLGSFDWG